MYMYRAFSLFWKICQYVYSPLLVYLHDMYLYMYVCAHMHTHTAKSSKTSKKFKKKQTTHTAVLTPDYTHLTFGHHKAIIAALALLPHLLPHSAHPQSTTDIPFDRSESAEGVGEACKHEAKAIGLESWINLLLIGLGGGALPMFINKCIPNVSCYG